MAAPQPQQQQNNIPAPIPTAAQQASQSFNGATGAPSLIDILAKLGLITSPPPQQGQQGK